MYCQSVCINNWWKKVKKTEQMGPNWITKYSIFTEKNPPLVGAWSNTATGCPEWFWSPCLWRYSKTQVDVAQSSLLWLTLFWSGVGLGGCLKKPSSLIFYVILCCVQADEAQEKPIGRNVRLLLFSLVCCQDKISLAKGADVGRRALKGL